MLSPDEHCWTVAFGNSVESTYWFHRRLYVKGILAFDETNRFFHIFESNLRIEKFWCKTFGDCLVQLLCCQFWSCKKKQIRYRQRIYARKYALYSFSLEAEGTRRLLKNPEDIKAYIPVYPLQHPCLLLCIGYQSISDFQNSTNLVFISITIVPV